jgi:hypothetical protein
VGLENTKARLEQAYAGRSELGLRRAAERGTIVELSLPVAQKEISADEPQEIAVPQIPRLPQGA